jgi:hypothetical protein
MVTYLAIPKVRVTFGATVTDGFISGNVELAENNYWKAELVFSNTPVIYPTTVNIGTTVLIEVQDGAVGGAWTTLFNGTVLAPDFTFDSSSATVKLVCVGLGYALNMMNIAEEYGSQSRNATLNTLKEILTDNTSGVVPKWVNKYKGGSNDSGYSIATTYVSDLTGLPLYISSPWKPANKFLDDLCDLNTALTVDTSINLTAIGAGSTTTVKVSGSFDHFTGSYIYFTSGVNNGLSRPITSAVVTGGPAVTTYTCEAFPSTYTPGDTITIHTSSGPHWIVDNSGNLRVKRIGTSQTNWSNYCGGSQGNATLVNGEDFFDGDFQPVGKEANVILYYGTWCRPSSGDGYTEPTDDTTARAVWYATGTGTTVYADTTDHIIGSSSVKITDTTPQNSPGNFMGLMLGGNGVGIGGSPLNWDFTTFTGDPKLVLELYILKKTNVTGGFIRIHTSDCVNDYWTYDWTSDVTAVDKWVHFSIPVGPYYDKTESVKKWGTFGSPNWNTIIAVEIIFAYTASQTGSGLIDGFHFTGANIVRIARQCFPAGDSYAGTLGQTTNPIRFKVLTDNIGKDDSLSAVDDTGLMAQLSKAELLRAVKATINGRFSTPLIKDVMPGQYFYIGVDWRITKVTHNLATMRSTFEVTDDVTNSHTRLRYEDINKQYAAIRPEYQDRQASSLKSGSMDIRIVPLEKAYDI